MCRRRCQQIVHDVVPSNNGVDSGNKQGDEEQCKNQETKTSTTTATTTTTACKMMSRVIPHTARQDRGDIHRCFNPNIQPKLKVYGCRTLYEGFRRGVRINADGPCLGAFDPSSSSSCSSDIVYQSYSECAKHVDAFAAGLETLSLLQPIIIEDNNRMSVLGLFLENCREWVVAEHAVYSIGGTLIPLYDSLNADMLCLALQQTGVKAVVCTCAELPRLCEAKLHCPCLTTVILVGDLTKEVSCSARNVGLEVLSFEMVEEAGKRHIAIHGHTHHPPNPTDVATFSFTSGTTGNSKAAMITHQNIISSIAGLQIWPHIMAVTKNDRHLSYLPAANIFERLVLSQFLLVGASIAFSRCDATLLLDDFRASRPTIVPVAPRVLNKIYDKITEEISAAGGIQKRLFDFALAAKIKGLQKGHLKHALYDCLIFNRIKKRLGMDQVRVMVSGSAPLSPRVLTFVRSVLGIPVLEAYGQTECTAAATLSHPDDVGTFGHVGGPTGCVEIALYDAPEMGYLHTDRVHHGQDSNSTTNRQQSCCGRGEVCIRGPNVFLGYFRDSEMTRQVIDDEGWLHSGDIGLWRPDGALQIIDRKANLIYLSSNGEYVSPEMIESILARSTFVSQCCVCSCAQHGVFDDDDDGTSVSKLVAIVVPKEASVRAWAAQQQQQQQQQQDNDNAAAVAAAADFEQLCQNEQLEGAILTDFQRLSQQAGLSRSETVQAILVTATPFSVENDLRTRTFKLKRQSIWNRYRCMLDVVTNSRSSRKETIR